MKPIDEKDIENKILDVLDYTEGMTSNDLFRNLRVGKKKFTSIKKKMIESHYITEEKVANRTYLRKAEFEQKEKNTKDVGRANSDSCLAYLRVRKPIAKKRKNGEYYLTAEAKKGLKYLFWNLDRLQIRRTRLEYAKSFVLLRPNTASQRINNCTRIFDDSITQLFSDHKKFHNLIVDYYQSQVREIKFKL